MKHRAVIEMPLPHETANKYKINTLVRCCHRQPIQMQSRARLGETEILDLSLTTLPDNYIRTVR